MAREYSDLEAVQKWFRYKGRLVTSVQVARKKFEMKEEQWRVFAEACAEALGGRIVPPLQPEPKA